MNAESKRIAKNTIYLYMRTFIMMLVSLYAVRVVLNTLGVEDYGTYNAIGGVVLALSFVSSILSNASQRFFSLDIGRNDTNSLSESFKTLLFVYIAISAFIVIVLETIGLWFIYNKMTIPDGRELAVMWVYQCSIVSFVISLICNPFQALIISHENMNVYAYTSIFDASIRLLLVFVLSIIPGDKLILYAVLMLFSTAVSNGLYVLYSLFKYPESRTKLGFTKSKINEVSSYSIWTVVGTFSFMCNNQGINILLNMFFGPVANASYSIANQVKGGINTFSGGFFSAMRPPLVKSYAKNDFSYMKRLLLFSSKTIFILLYILILPLFLEVEPILKLWLGNIHPEMVSYTRLLFVYAIIMSMGDPITALMDATGRVKLYHGIIDTYTLIILPIVYILFKCGFDSQWAFIISIIVFISAHIIRMLMMNNVLNISFFSYTREVIIPIVITILLSSIPSFLLYRLSGSGFVGVIANCMFSFFLALIMSYMIVLNKAERIRVKELIKSKINRRKYE